MRLKCLIFWITGSIAVLVGLALGYYHFILDWNGRPFCHVQIHSAFMVLMHNEREWGVNSATNTFPNVDGISRDSLATISDGMNGYMDWARNYKYVPGLREDDPGDLVLMYIDQPTRWTWHGSTPTIFKEKEWVVVPVDFTLTERRGGPGELSERISQKEFKTRLNRTLDFIRTNERPNWQAVVAEHKKFLESIGPDEAD